MRKAVGLSFCLVACALIAAGCSSEGDEPCGGSDTCPQGFSCQDRGGGYRCFEREQDASEPDSDPNSSQHDSSISAMPGTSGMSGSAGHGDDMMNVTGAGEGAGSGAGGGGSGADGGAGSVSAGSNGMPTQGTQTVLFLIDGSGSMCDTFGSSTRWAALRSALLDPADGLINALQHSVDFGVMVFDGSVDIAVATMAVGQEPSPMCVSPMPMTSECPQLKVAAPAKDNAAAIDAIYPAVEPGGSTPTDKAMNAAVDQLISASVAAPPPRLVLVTDGLPNDICVGGMGGDGVTQQLAVIAAVDRAAMAGIEVYALGLSTSPLLGAHLLEVARHGKPRENNAHAYIPATQAELLSALEELTAP